MYSRLTTLLLTKMSTIMKINKKYARTIFKTMLRYAKDYKNIPMKEEKIINSFVKSVLKRHPHNVERDSLGYAIEILELELSFINKTIQKMSNDEDIESFPEFINKYKARKESVSKAMEVLEQNNLKGVPNV